MRRKAPAPNQPSEDRLADFERIEPGTTEWVRYHANHIWRYIFATNQLRDRGAARVLDAACGVGYGSKHLARELRADVVAVDRDAQALATASKLYADPLITWCQDDCATLVAASAYGPFDAVVSMETVEHLPDPSAFLRRCAELATREARLIASTPNSLVTEAQGERNWKYHEKEYSPEELITLVESCGWRNPRLYGQRLNSIGRLREDMRREIHALATRPFNRLGEAIQRVARGHVSQPPLPERVDDFELLEFASASDCRSLGADGPFVLICVATR